MSEHEKKRNEPSSSLLVCTGVVLLLVWLPTILKVAMAYYDAGASFEPAETIGKLLGLTGFYPSDAWWDVVISGGLFLGVALGIRYVVKTGPDPRPAARVWLVGILGITTLAVYVVNFLLPFPIIIYYDHQRIAMGHIAGRSTGGFIGTALAIVALFILYYLAYRLCRKQTGRWLWAIVLGGAVLFALVNAFVHASTSTDIWDYIAGGRIVGLHGDNPYLKMPDDYPDDLFMAQAAWRNAVSAYGPFWIVLSGLIGRFAGNTMWTNVLAYKSVALISYLVSVLCIAAALKRVAPERALAGTLLFAWNPLVLMEAIANAQNDTLMVALVIGGLWVLTQARWARGEEPQQDRFWDLVVGGLAMLLLALGVLIKFIPLLLLPPFLMLLTLKEKRWWLKLGVGLALLVPVALVFYQFYRELWIWPSLKAFIQFQQRLLELFRGTLASLFEETLWRYLYVDRTGDVARLVFVDRFEGFASYALIDRVGELKPAVSRLFLSLFGFCYAVLIGRTALALHEKARPADRPAGRFVTIAGKILGRPPVEGRRPWQIVATTCLHAMTLFLLLGSTWAWPWYLMWPIALLALSDDERPVLPLAIAACFLELGHLVWNFVWYWIGITWETTWLLDKVVVFGTVVPAAVVYFASLYRDKMSQAAVAENST